MLRARVGIRVTTRPLSNIYLLHHKTSPYSCGSSNFSAEVQSRFVSSIATKVTRYPSLIPKTSVINKNVFPEPLFSQAHVSIQRRNYIFLPSSLSDLAETFIKTFPSLQNLIDSSPKHRRNLKLKLRERVRIKVSSLSLPVTKLSRVKAAKTFQSNIQNARQDVQLAWKEFLHSSPFENKENFLRWWKRVQRKSKKSGRKLRFFLTTDKSRRTLLPDDSFDITKKEHLLFSKNFRKRLRHTYNVTILSMKANVKEKYRVKLENYREIWKPKTVVIKEPTRTDWFDEDGFPLTSRHWLTNRFVNPWQSESSDGKHPLEKVWKWRLQRIWNQIEEAREYYEQKRLSNKKDEPSIDEIIQASDNDVGLNSFFPSQHDKIRLTWIGHATCFVSMHGFNLLTDPVFSERASPIQLPGFGVGRSMPPSTPISNLLNDHCLDIDAVLISHDHYDHLDYDSVMQLSTSEKVKYWIVPLGIKKWLMKECDIDESRIMELEWWEKVHFRKVKSKEGGEKVIIPLVTKDVDVDSLIEENDDLMTITCAPTHHWCCRTPFDRNKRLWCSFAVQTIDNSNTDNSSTLNFYFGGDTALPPTFPLHRQIGDRLGPFDLAALPIGAYEPQYFMRHSHCNPKEAFQIHNDIRSKKSVGIHWGTFPLAEEGLNEPAVELLRVIKRKKEEATSKENQNFCVVGFGSHVESDGNEVKEEVEIISLLDTDEEDVEKYG